MPRHYLVIREFLKEYVTRVYTESDWQQRVFEDLTSGGKKLLLTVTRSGALGLCGDLFFCEASIDKDRNDALFLYRLESAEKRLPKKVPRTYRGIFRLATEAQPAQEYLDPAGPIFDIVRPIEPLPARAKEIPAEPSLQLKGLLGQIPEPAPRPWLPRSETLPGADLLNNLQQAWRRFELRRHLLLTPRQVNILEGRIRNPAGLIEIVKDIARCIDLEIFNRVARRPNISATEFNALLNTLAVLPLPEGIRSLIWQHSISGMPVVDQRAEIIAALDLLDIEPPEKRKFWVASVQRALVALAKSVNEYETADQISLAASPLTASYLWSQVRLLDSRVDEVAHLNQALHHEEARTPVVEPARSETGSIVENASTSPAQDDDGAASTTESPQLATPMTADSSRSCSPPAEGLGLSPKQASVFRLLNQPVDVTLANGDRLQHVVLSMMNGEVVYLENGGMLLLDNIRMLYPKVLSESSMPVDVASPRVIPRPDSPAPDLLRENASSTAGSAAAAPSDIPAVPLLAPDVAPVPNKDVTPPETPQPSLVLGAGLPAAAQTLQPAIERRLRELSQPFHAQVEGYSWRIVEVPSVPSRFPTTEMPSSDRTKALKRWSQGLSYLKDRNLAEAREALLKLSGLLETAVEPVWGAAYAAAQAGDRMMALAILQHRSHLLSANPELARSEVSLALQLGLLQTVSRLLVRYAGPPTNFARDCILYHCGCGLTRRIVVLIENEPPLWHDYGQPLLAYLLLGVAKNQPTLVSEFVAKRDELRFDNVLPLLLTHARDEPEAEYERAGATEVSLHQELEKLRNEIRASEVTARDAAWAASFEEKINAKRRSGAFAEALETANRAVKLCRSQEWKQRFRSLIDEIRQESSNLSLQQSRSDIAFKGRLSATVANLASTTPLWRQASDAAVHGRLDEAIEKYRAFLTQAIETGWTEHADRALNGLAMVYDRLQERDKAIEVMLEHRHRVRSSLRFNNQIATLYYLTGDFQKSAEHFSEAAKLAAAPLEKQKAQENARNARLRAGSRTTEIPLGIEGGAVDEYGEELAREYLEQPLHLNLQMREVTSDLDLFLEPDIERLSKAGMEMYGIDRGRVAREDFDYTTVQRLLEQAQRQQRTQGVRSQLLASALYIIYQKGWNQNAEALQKINPIVLQTQLAGSLGDDAAAQNRNEVAREYYACLLERNSKEQIALFKVRDFIRTFTGERFDPEGAQKHRMDRFRDLLIDRSEAGTRVVWGVLSIAGLSLNAYNAVLEAIGPVRECFDGAITELFSEGEEGKTEFEAAVIAARRQERRIEDQFYRFRRPIRADVSLPALCESFLELDTELPHNTLDFGRDGRILRWKRELVVFLQQYFAAKSAAEKELRFQQARTQLDLARDEILTKSPTRFARLNLLPILRSWSEALQSHYEEWEETVVPEFQVRCLQVISRRAGYEVELLISNDRLSRTAHEVKVALELGHEDWSASLHGSSDEPTLGTLEGGREEPQSWLITSSQSDVLLSLPASVHISHLDHQGRTISSTHSLEIPIRPLPYRCITNPYDPGPPVTREDMLKGREELVSRLVRGVSDREASPFFRVIGPRRVGKSSIVEAVARRLRKDPELLVPDRIDLAAMGTLTHIESVLRGWSMALCEEGRDRGMEIADWKWDRVVPIPQAFLTWITRTVRPLAHPVILLDEFQSIAEKLVGETLKDFMDFWKFMVEKRLLSGIVCGVDSMDELIAGRGFGNQFASIKTEKVGYLSKEAARDLIEQPVPLPDDLPEEFSALRGGSRYTAGAVEAIVELTAASPFYLQLLCHNIVHTLNEEENMLVTEMTIKKALRALRERWDFASTFENLTKFQPKPGLEDDNDYEQEVEGRILYTIALATLDRPYCDVRAEVARWRQPWSEDAQKVLTELVRREVVVSNDSGLLHRIQVGLFQKWLQTNRIFGDHPAPEERPS